VFVLVPEQPPGIVDAFNAGDQYITRGILSSFKAFHREPPPVLPLNTQDLVDHGSRFNQILLQPGWSVSNAPGKLIYD
jgi:hypothetical protein